MKPQFKLVGRKGDRYLWTTYIPEEGVIRSISVRHGWFWSKPGYESMWPASWRNFRIWDTPLDTHQQVTA